MRPRSSVDRTVNTVDLSLGTIEVVADDDSTPPTQTRRAFMASTCPFVGVGASDAVYGAIGGDPAKRHATRRGGTDAVATPAPPYPDDPLIVPSHGNQFFAGDEQTEGRGGWEPTTVEQKVRTIVCLHPDALDFHVLEGWDDGRVVTPDVAVEMLDSSRRPL